MQTKLIVTLVLVGLAVLFIVQNAAVVDIRFLFWKLSMSRALFMFFMLAVGIVTGWVLHSYFLHKKDTQKQSTQ
ncbi:lipopolysaccharide assembly protein LapA domain-containing protein [Kaarinaea lacus]